MPSNLSFVQRCCAYLNSAISTVKQALPALMVCALSFAAIMPYKTNAWGFQGHTYIGDLTWEYLSPEARAWVQDKLQRVDEQSLGVMITWADRVRSTPEGRAMGPLHFANVPPTETSFVMERDCPNHRCVVGAAMNSAEVMFSNNSSEQEKAEALRVFTHWITDLHQPLHLGFYEDRGGNSIRITYLGRHTNLHSLWDTIMLRNNMLLEPSQLATDNPLPAAPGDLNAALIEWATDSNHLAREYAYKAVEHEGEVTEAYIQRATPIVQQQLLLSAQRLAYFIEAAARL